MAARAGTATAVAAPTRKRSASNQCSAAADAGPPPPLCALDRAGTSSGRAACATVAADLRELCQVCNHAAKQAVTSAGGKRELCAHAPGYRAEAEHTGTADAVRHRPCWQVPQAVAQQ